MGCGSSQPLVIEPTRRRSLLTSRPPRPVTQNPYVITQKLPKPYEFPTASVLQERQDVYSARNLDVDEDENNHPLPFPTPTLKNTVFSPEQYIHLDEHAVKTSFEHAKKGYEELTRHLTKDAENDLQKVRVIFRWLAAQDLAKMSFSKRPERGTLQYCLWRIKCGVTSFYDTLLCELLECADIHAVKLEGVVKGVNYSIGDSIVDKPQDYIGGWVAVLLNKQWRLIDQHWGSSHIEGQVMEDYWKLVYGDEDRLVPEPVKSSQLAVKYSFNEFYFLTDPAEFVYSHLPQDARWQLLARQVTLGEFNDMAYLRPGFFNLGMRVINHPECIVHVIHGEFELQVGLPKDRVLRFRHLLYTVADNADTLGQNKLERYMFRERRDDVLRIKIWFPKQGVYKLELYGNDASLPHNFNMELLRYIINCEKASEDAAPMPISDRKEWGPGPGVDAVGMTALTHMRGVVQANKDGMCEIRFRMNTPMEFLYTFKHDEMCEDELKRFVMYRIIDDNVVFNVKCPRQGMYGLGLFARSVGCQASVHYTSICDYLIEAEQACEYKTPYPDIKKGGFGATEKYKEFDLESNLSVFMTSPDSGELSMNIKSPSAMHFQAILVRMNEERLPATAASKYTFFEYKDNSSTITMRFREIGVYHLKLHGKPTQVEGDMPILFNAMIQADWPKPGATPFPSALASWGVGHELIEPTKRQLPPGMVVPFALRVPKATMVAVSEGEVWTDLTKDEEDVWRGEVETGMDLADLKVSYCWDAALEEYATLLVYQVVTSEIWEEMERIQGRTVKIVDKKREAKIKKLHKEYGEVDAKLQRLEELLSAENEKDMSNIESFNMLSDFEEFAELKMEIQDQITEFERIRALYDDVIHKKKDIIHAYQGIIKRRRLDEDPRGLLNDFKKLELKKKYLKEENILKAFADNQLVRDKLQEDVGGRLKRLRDVEREVVKVHEATSQILEKLETLRHVLENHISQFETFNIVIPDSAVSYEERIDECQNNIDMSSDRRLEDTEHLSQVLKYLLQMRESLDVQDHIVYNWDEQNVSMARTEQNMQGLALMLKEESESLRLEDEARNLHMQSERAAKERRSEDQRLRKESQTLEAQLERIKTAGQGEAMPTEEKSQVLRRLLEIATKTCDRDAIKKALADFKKHNVSNRGEVEKAKKMLEVLRCREELEDVMKANDIEEIQRCMQVIADSEIKAICGIELLKAKAVVDRLLRIQKLMDDLQLIDNSQIGEIRGFREAPPSVVEVMAAVFLLLGENEKVTRDWHSCQKMIQPIGPNSLKIRLTNIEFDQLHPEIAARAKNILEVMDVDDIRLVCEGVSRLYSFAMGILTESEIARHGETHAPANIKRQIEIFAMKDERDKKRQPKKAKKAKETQPS